MIKAFFFSTVVLISFSTSAAIISSKVPAQDGRSCLAHLRLPETKTKLPVIVALKGAGLYSMADDSNLPSTVSYFYDQEKAIVLTIEKPGVSWVDNKIDIDSSIYNQYLLTDRVHCLKAALKKMTKMKKLPFNGQIVLLGHGEGAIALTRLILSYEKQGSSQLDKIKLILLSGVPVDKYKSVIKYRLDKKESQKFWKAFETKDNDYFRMWGGVAFPYLENNFKLKSVQKVMSELVNLKNQSKFHIFHGLDDQLAPVSKVKGLEAWNESLKKNQKPSLDLNVRYYQSDHFLNLTAIGDMIAIMKEGLR